MYIHMCLHTQIVPTAIEVHKDVDINTNHVGKTIFKWAIHVVYRAICVPTYALTQTTRPKHQPSRTKGSEPAPNNTLRKGFLFAYRCVFSSCMLICHVCINTPCIYVCCICEYAQNFLKEARSPNRNTCMASLLKKQEARLGSWCQSSNGSLEKGDSPRHGWDL